MHTRMFHPVHGPGNDPGQSPMASAKTQAISLNPTGHGAAWNAAGASYSKYDNYGYDEAEYEDLGNGTGRWRYPVIPKVKEAPTVLYEVWDPEEERRRKESYKSIRHSFLVAILLAFSLLVTTGAAEVATAAPVGSGLALGDFNVYTDGQQLLSIEDALNGTFWFSFAETYQLDPAILETARGIKLGDTDAEVLAAYGHLDAFVEYSCNRIGNVLPEVNFESYMQSAQYTCDYTATFRAFTVGGRFETDEARVQQLYSGDSKKKELVEYGVTIRVENGVVNDIECYTHPIQ